jgi:muconolactone D-isomerase
MEFLVRQSSSGAGSLSPERHEELRAAERARAGELRESGILIRLWRVLGSNDSIGLYRADDADALHEALRSLPMFPWLRFTVEPLVTHPQEKALLKGKALLEDKAPLGGKAMLGGKPLLSPAPVAAPEQG